MVQNHWVKQAEFIDKEDYTVIKKLQEHCIKEDKVALKLELDYKLAVSEEATKGGRIQKINEFMYFDGQELIGYIGICRFGGEDEPIEVTGMVHPDYRRLGIFKILYDLVIVECKRRNVNNILLLCDCNSVSGEKFLECIGAHYQNSEFEMYLEKDSTKPLSKLLGEIMFRKATNADAYEIARQDAIYFRDNIALPEEDETVGMVTYLAEVNHQVIGKVRLDLNTAIGGIYGLGVVPEFRGKGYGRAILLFAVEKLKEAKVDEIMLQVVTMNTNALNLYKSCGFVETSMMDYYRKTL